MMDNIIKWCINTESDINEYETIKNNIVVRVVPAAVVPDSVYVFEVFGGLALCPVFVSGDLSRSGVCKADLLDKFEFLPSGVVSSWSVRQNVFFDDAISNTEKYFSLSLKRSPLDKIEKDIDTFELKTESMPMISTLFNYDNGVIALWYKDVCKKISEKWNDSFYISFVAADCAILHKFGTIEPETIRKHLKSTNKMFSGDDKFLTDNVFYYDKNKEHIFMYKTHEYQKYSDIIDCLQFEDYKNTCDICSEYDVSEKVIDYIVENIDKISYTTKHEFIENLIEMF